MKVVGWCVAALLWLQGGGLLLFCLVWTVLPFGISRSQFPPWKPHNRASRNNLCIWPRFTMWPLSRRRRDLSRAGLWQCFCWRPPLFDWLSPPTVWHFNPLVFPLPSPQDERGRTMNAPAGVSVSIWLLTDAGHSHNIQQVVFDTSRGRFEKGRGALRKEKCWNESGWHARREENRWWGEKKV